MLGCTNLATRDTATGIVLIVLPPCRYSVGVSSFLPQNPKYIPIIDENTSMSMKSVKSSQPNNNILSLSISSVVEFITILKLKKCLKEERRLTVGVRGAETSILYFVF
jgi:hypothetical protein